MFFVNLGAGEFLTLFTTLSGIITALYLLDRSKRKKVVSTLRFWSQAVRAEESQNRRRMRQPWSFLLQLLSVLLLLLAIAQLEWGSRKFSVRDHVLLLDRSSITSEKSAAGTVLDEEKRLALRYLSGISGRERVMLVRVDALATAATPFTTDREQLTREINASTSGYSALNIDHALSFARQMRGVGKADSEIVYIGPKRISEPAASTSSVPGLRVIPVTSSVDNCGIRSISLKPGESLNSWRAEITLKNYGLHRKTLMVSAQFAATPFTPREVTLDGQSDTVVEYHFITAESGKFTARISPHDSFTADDEGGVVLPPNGIIRVAAVSMRPDALRPLLESNHRLQVQYVSPADYSPSLAADVILLDQFAPREWPHGPSLWINPPTKGSPLPIAGTFANQAITQWGSEVNAVATSHNNDVVIPEGKIFQIFQGDTVIAGVANGPIVVTRAAAEGHAKCAVVGFDPAIEPLRYTVASPLLFAELTRWLVPDLFRAVELRVDHAGLTEIALARDENPDHLRVAAQNGQPIPFTVRDNQLQLFVDAPATLQAGSDGHERTLSLTLPEVPEFVWEPRIAGGSHSARFAGGTGKLIDLWRWLAVLGLAAMLFEWFLYGDRRRWNGRLLKSLAALACIAALFGPRMTLPQSRIAGVVLMDTSGSITHAGFEHAASLINQIRRKQRENWMEVIPFAKRPQPVSIKFAGTPVDQKPWRSDDAAATNIEAALTGSIAAFPSGYLARVALLSDGNETEGSTARAIAQLERLRIPVDTFALNTAATDNVQLLAASVPGTAYTGEQMPVDLTIESPRSTQVTVAISADGKQLGTDRIDLKAGRNVARLHAQVKSTGTTLLSGHIVARGLGETRFESATELRRAKLLYVSQDPAGTETNLMQAFREAQFDVTTDTSLLDTDLRAIQLVILNNLDLNTLSRDRKRHIEAYVKSGGGLLLIGGEKQSYKDDKQMDELDAVLPAKLQPPETPEGICVALIIDKSSSMEGQKIELARISAGGVVDHLRPHDSIGVLMFDNSYQWAVPMRRATDKGIIKRQIAGITPDGGTQIAPALAEAYRKVMSSKGTYKHIVLLTDGISEEGDSLELAKEALFHQITISTVGLGQDVNRSYLEKIAAASGGRSYFLNEPQGLEDILLKDVQDYSGSTAVEKDLKPMVERKAEILSDINIEDAPALKGYARFAAKPGSEVVLGIRNEKKDPLYVRWQYGLGRAGVFASDAKSRWAEAWVNWPGFDRFWTNVARDLIKRRETTEVNARFDTANEDVAVTYRLRSGNPGNHVPQMFVLGPQGFERPMTLRRTAPDTYEGRVHTGALTGLFRIRSVEESSSFPEAGVYRQDEEYRHFGVNERLLREIAAMTGGRYEPDPESLFKPDGRVTYSTRQLWPVLLAFGIAFSLAELVARKWRGVIQRFRGRPLSGMPAMPSASGEAAGFELVSR